MGAASYISKHFVGKELCISLGNDAETITYDQAWAANREYFRGVIQEVDEGIVVMLVEKNGPLFINGDDIECFWQPGFDYHKAIHTSLTRRLQGARRKDIY